MESFKKISNVVFGLKHLNIKKTDYVLDIGSGNNPHFRADVICDKYVGDDVERGENTIIIDRPFICCDACKLPFKDNTFDYVICRHLIEHLDNPEILINELMRVGKRGYIEAPNELWERLFGRKFHKWFINVENNKLILKPKKKVIEAKVYHNFQKLCDTDKDFNKFYNNNIKLFHVIYEWDKKISYEIKGKLGKTRKQSDIKQTPNPKKTQLYLLPIKQKLLFIIRSLLYYIYRKKGVIDIFALLVCPQCKCKLNHNKSLTCPQCKSRFNIRNNIPIMLNKQKFINKLKRSIK
jgi:uncharacterized protein YbaR (Trm112 family)/SAM-dependent methyltransferase